MSEDPIDLSEALTLNDAFKQAKVDSEVELLLSLSRRVLALEKRMDAVGKLAVDNDVRLGRAADVVRELKQRVSKAI